VKFRVRHSALETPAARFVVIVDAIITYDYLAGIKKHYIIKMINFQILENNPKINSFLL